MNSENDKENNEIKDATENNETAKTEATEEAKELSLEDQLKESQDKLLRTLAEVENQRRRYEKETREAFEYGGFNFARETLSVLDNLQRAHQSIQSDESLKDNKDLNKFLENRITFSKLLKLIGKISCLNEFTKYKKMKPKSIEDIYKLRDYVSLKLSKLGI